MSVQIERLKQYPKYYSIRNLEKLSSRMNKELCWMAPIIINEELSELQQAVSKWIRYNTSCIKPDDFSRERNYLNLIEEIADVTIALNMVKHMANISTEEINQMISYKIDRNKQKLDSKSITNNSQVYG